MFNYDELEPGTICIASSKGLIAAGIGYWWVALNFTKILMKHGLGAALRLFKVWTSHTMVYFGGANHGIIEATIPNVRYGKLNEFINKKSNVLFYYNKNLSEANFIYGKVFAFNQIGKRYDIPAFLNFLLDSVIEAKDAFICTEFVVAVMDKMMLPCMPGVERYKIHPNELLDWLNTEGKKHGWEHVSTWKGK